VRGVAQPGKALGEAVSLRGPLSRLSPFVAPAARTPFDTSFTLVAFGTPTPECLSQTKDANFATSSRTSARGKGFSTSKTGSCEVKSG
jgi:hypothetical protein